MCFSPVLPLAADPFHVWIAGGLAALLILALVLTYVAGLNRRLKKLSARLESQLAERKRAEDALAASEAFYHSLVEHLPLMIIRKDAEGRFIFGNPRFCQEINRPLAELEGKTDFDLFPKHLAEKYRQDDVRVMTSGVTLDAVEEHDPGDGNKIYVQVLKTPVRDASGKTVGVQGIFWDVTQRRRAEEALVKSETRTRMIVDTANDAFVEMDEEGRITAWNPAAEQLFGWTRDEAVGRFVRQTIVPEHYRQRHQEGLDRFLNTGQHQVLNRRFEITALRRDGVEFPIEITISPIQLGSDVFFASFIQDVTVRKEAERALVQQEKLAGLGQMVAGVAHEINNPLSFVSNNVVVMQRDVKAIRELLEEYARADQTIAAADPQAAARIKALADRIDLAYTLPNFDDLIARSRDGLKRIQQIVRDLRDFARLDSSDMHDVNLNDGVQSTVNIIRGRAKSKQVAINVQLQDLPPVTCYPAKINQVIMNLLANAIDACDRGGRVDITTRAKPEGVEIEVSDNGSGIDPAAREKLFDPFFTTKPLGEGTGLGLSISYGIVKDHGGTIRVESEKGQGAVFTIRLPLSGPALPAAT